MAASRGIGAALKQDWRAAGRRRVGELETVVERLDRDLDESRRLNLRAAELLDIVQSEIVARASAAGV